MKSTPLAALSLPGRTMFSYDKIEITGLEKVITVSNQHGTASTYSLGPGLNEFENVIIGMKIAIGPNEML